MSNYDLEFTLYYDDGDIPTTYRLEVMHGQEATDFLLENSWGGNSSEPSAEGNFYLQLIVDGTDTPPDQGECIGDTALQGIDTSDPSQEILIEIIQNGMVIGNGTVKSVDAQQESRPSS